MLGLESYLDELRVSERVYQERKADADRRDKLLSNPKVIQDARDMNAEMKRSGELWKDLATTFSASGPMGDALDALQAFNGVLAGLQPLAKQAGEALGKPFNDLRDFAIQTAAILAGMNPIDALNLVKMANDAQKAAANLQQQAAQKQVQAASQFAQAVGFMGGGARARGALPQNLVPFLQGAQAGPASEFDAILNGRTMRLGAWSL